MLKQTADEGSSNNINDQVYTNNRSQIDSLKGDPDCADTDDRISPDVYVRNKNAICREFQLTY